jgi:murein DD-endopeptidase MepM/ murein hydrolase activator NlpD
LSYIGRHRKHSLLQTATRRLALSAVVAGTVTTAGMAGMASASAQIPDVTGMSSAATGAVNQVATAAGIADIMPAASVVRPAAGTFTSGFGPRWGTMHNGIDIANAIGTPIYSVMSGTVINSGPASGFGQWIRVKHDDGSMAVYGHMSTLNVGVGQRVSAGQHIAGMGSEGFSTGSHLHFEIHPSGNGAVDPVPWFAAHGIYF